VVSVANQVWTSIRFFARRRRWRCHQFYQPIPPNCITNQPVYLRAVELEPWHAKSPSVSPDAQTHTPAHISKPSKLHSWCATLIQNRIKARPVKTTCYVDCGCKKYVPHYFRATPYPQPMPKLIYISPLFRFFHSFVILYTQKLQPDWPSSILRVMFLRVMRFFGGKLLALWSVSLSSCILFYFFCRSSEAATTEFG
jgi:hypothetical protein